MEQANKWYQHWSALPLAMRLPAQGTSGGACTVTLSVSIDAAGVNPGPDAVCIEGNRRHMSDGLQDVYFGIN
jgi:hypothetical protein